MYDSFDGEADPHMALGSEKANGLGMSMVKVIGTGPLWFWNF